ncbi:TonB-dependent receptor [Sunxiuqinia indica]|uniref:TonB-dependent receptor n=1 Tax=Sunxiuqinia indica TaxID=2692584 RepID=UPI001358998D|nr:TonB-dependent receptor plug domain-containing protein [Sunxiuqinia indica]
MNRYLIIILLLVSTCLSWAQPVEINCQQKQLNELLVELRDSYDLQLSFDDENLSRYKVSVSKNFSSPENAFDYLLKDLPVAYEKAGEVFLFYQDRRTTTRSSFLLSGQVKDRLSSEALPYSNLSVNGLGMVTDQQGLFSLVSVSDSLFHIRVSYLGYYLKDTVVKAGSHLVLTLTPSTYELREIQVEGSRVVKSLQTGNKAGVMRANHQVAKYLPGNGDNSVFNLLRLQPGILAAGEQSNDLVIWGSYEGQTQVLFDGFTLFGMKNFNDNISAVNPFMAKDILVLKGAYEAKYGGRVGGLVNITGIDGDTRELDLKLSLNNMTLNGLLSIPVKKRSALVLAFRQTYYELYDSRQLSFRNNRGVNSPAITNQTIYPDYNFRDLNVKYSGSTSGGDMYSISTLIAEDRFSNNLDLSDSWRGTYEDHEHNKQYALSAFYQKNWDWGARTKFSGAFSTLNKEVGTVRLLERQRNNGNGMGSGHNNRINKNQQLLNEVSEANFSVDNQIPLAEKHQLTLGSSLIFNDVSFTEDSFDVQIVRQEHSGSRFNLYLEDAISLSRMLELKLGLRTSYSLNLNQFFWQPRISAGIQLTNAFKLNLAAGIHNQFINRSSLIDDDGNYHYYWLICDEKTVPVLDAKHFVTGLTYHQNDFTFSLESFYKETEGLTRYIRNLRFEDVFEGQSKTTGLDVFLKQDFGAHSAWVSYTLSETLERFDYFQQQTYHRALHDQRHEVKTAVLFNFNPFHFSANYVYGSGFPDPRLTDSEDFERDYHRLDVSATYSWQTKSFVLEGGLSILNLLDYNNLKYANFIQVPDDQELSINLQAEAIPFTPTVFLNFSF